MTRLEELTLMIQRGWGDVPQNKISSTWREFWGPGLTHRPPSPYFQRTHVDLRRPDRREYSKKQNVRYRNETPKPEARRALYLSEKACPFPPGSQFRFPFSFPEAG